MRPLVAHRRPYRYHRSSAFCQQPLERQGVGTLPDRRFGRQAERCCRVENRLNVEQLLQEEVEAGSERVGVVVCEPGGLCHDIRATVAAASKLRQTDFELQAETCSF